jgi:DNA-directed RNA polymerase III subunit RPC1
LFRSPFQGVPTIRRAVINIKERDDAKGKKGDKELLVEGYGLQKVMTTEGAPYINISLRSGE